MNGVVKQDGNTKNLIWDEAHMVRYLTSILTLYPGDVISSGTPDGVGAGPQAAGIPEAGRRRHDRDRGHRHAARRRCARRGAGDAMKRLEAACRGERQTGGASQGNVPSALSAVAAVVRAFGCHS